MSTVRIRAVAAFDSDSDCYFIPEKSLVFIHTTDSTVFVTDDRTTATLAHHIPQNLDDYTCIGIALTAVNTRDSAFGARVFTYVAYGPQLVQCPHPNVFVGSSLQWSLSSKTVALETHKPTKNGNTFVGVLLELCDNDHVRIMVAPFVSNA